MSNQATPYFRDGRAFPSRKQMLDAVDDFDMLTARGLGLPEIAERMEVTGGTACVIRRWSLERAQGIEPQVEVRL